MFSAPFLYLAKQEGRFLQESYNWNFQELRALEVLPDRLEMKG